MPNSNDCGSCIILIFSIFFVILKVSEIQAVEFDYDDDTKWGEEFPTCNGRRQSPINIYSSEVVPLSMPKLSFVNYNDTLPGNITLENNCHTVLVKTATQSESSRPYITGGLLKNEYVFHELHFHWGKTNKNGSEHTIDSVRYPLEMHVVHRNKLYSYDEALTKGDGLSVVAVFFKVSQQEYQPLNYIIKYLKKVTKCKQSTQIPNFCLNDFFPKDKNFFYTYFGSLTTPPCAESLIWNILTQPMPISNYQLKMFRTLLGENGKPMSGNFRQTQPLNGRKVYKLKYFY